MANKERSKKQNLPQGNLKKSDAAFLSRLTALQTTIAGIYVVLMFVVHPMLISSQTYYEIDQVKLVFFWALTGCFLGVMLLICFLRRGMDPDYLKWKGFAHLRSVIRPHEWAAIALMVVIVISTALSELPMAAIQGTSNRNEGLINWFLSLGAALMVGRFYQRKERDLLLLCVTSAVVGGYGICQFYGHDFLNFAIEGYSSAGPNILFVSTMSNNNVASLYFGLAVVIGVVMFARMEKPWHVIYLPLAWVSFYIMILGGARSGYVGLAVAFALCFPFIAKDKKSTALLLWSFGSLAVLWRIAQAVYDGKIETLGWYPPWQHLEMLKPILLPAAGVCALAGAALWFLPIIPKEEFPKKPWRIGWIALVAVIVIGGVASVPTLAEKTGDTTLTQLSEIMQGNVDDRFASGRAFIWSRSVELWKENPIIGHGPDLFARVFDRTFGEESRALSGVRIDKAHNEYIQTLVDLGALGLGCLLAFYGLSLWGARKKIEERCVLAVGVALVFFLGQAMFNFASPFGNPVVWVLWGRVGDNVQ